MQERKAPCLVLFLFLGLLVLGINASSFPHALSQDYCNDIELSFQSCVVAAIKVSLILT